MHCLVIKTGALGDVIRTSYFALELKKKYGSAMRLSWFVSVFALPLIRFNPYIDDLWTNDEQIYSYEYDLVYSLDDELPLLEIASKVKTKKLVGGYVDSGNKSVYTEDANIWFDMGLLSRLGEKVADDLKKRNENTHSFIFSRIFGVNSPTPSFFNSPIFSTTEIRRSRRSDIVLGVNPFAGDRWGSKELRISELRRLLLEIINFMMEKDFSFKILLFGVGRDRERNITISNEISSDAIEVVNSDSSVLRFAAEIGALDYLITSDSLALHLAIAQQVPCVAFFSPTSAAEIDMFGVGEKVLSLDDDYCSYKADAKNKSITADRIMKAFVRVFGQCQ